MPVPPALLRVLAAMAAAAVLAGGALGPAPSAHADPTPVEPSATQDSDSTDPDGTDPDATDPDDYTAPLEVTIDDLTPGLLPRTGPLVVEGTITNVDLETWRDIRLYPLFGAGPTCTLCGEVMTTEADLATAAATDPEAPVGERYTSDDRVRAEVTSLEPGGSATYSIRIPQSVLRGLFGSSPTAGVYWFGVQALGASDSSPRDDLSDGRARTFLPALPPRIADDPSRSVPTAVVVPLRSRIEHTADGAIADTDAWARALGQDGELGGPLAFGVAAGSRALTWLVDPAVPDAVAALAQGNPDRSITPTPPASEESPGAGPSDDGSDGSTDSSATDPDVDPNDPLVAAARTWLDLLEPELTGDITDEVALLPYGDPDLSALGDAMSSLYPLARAHGSDVLTEWQAEGLPVVASPDGYLDDAGVHAVDDDATVLLGDQMFPVETFSDQPPADGLIDQCPVVVTSTEAASGGPTPEPRLSTTALRQRILSEAVVRAVEAGADGEPSPLVVVLPQQLVATGAAAFWAGLDVPGIDLVELSELTTAGSGDSSAQGDAERQIDTAALTYPESAEDAEISSAVLAEAARVIRSVGTLQDILGDDVRIADAVVGEALAGTSYAMRGDTKAQSRLAQTRGWVDDQLAGISISAPAGVTLSGESGNFNVAVSNDLDHTVTVLIEADTDSGASVKVAEPVTLAPHSRSSVPVEADTSRTGVHNVTLRLTDSNGNALGGEDTLPLRTGQVGIVIWAIMGSGLAILVGAIAVRLVRRVRRSRAESEVAA